MEVEVRGPLQAFGAAAVDKGVQNLKEELKATLLKEGEWYNDDTNFETAVKSATKAKRNVLADADKLPMGASSIKLTDWSLSEPERVAMLANWLQAGPAATTLDLSAVSRGISTEEVSQLAVAICANEKLEEVNMEGYALPVKKLKGIDPVESLDLSQKQLTPLSAALIASLIGVNGSLTSLNLTKNNIGGYWDSPTQKIVFTPEGPKAIADALGINGSLTTLLLNRCALGAEGAKALAPAIAGSGSLTKVRALCLTLPSVLLNPLCVCFSSIS